MPRWIVDHGFLLQPWTVIYMGDKSPKAKDKNKKQDTANKDQKKKDAVTKATTAPAGSTKKGK